MLIQRVLVFRKYNKKESECPSVTAASHNGAVSLPGSTSKQSLSHKCQQANEKHGAQGEGPFIPEVPGWGLAWIYQGGCQSKHSSPGRPDPHSSRGPPLAAAVGPHNAGFFPTSQPHLPNHAKPWQLWVLPTQSPSVLPAARHTPKSPPFKQRLGCIPLRGQRAPSVRSQAQHAQP